MSLNSGENGSVLKTIYTLFPNDYGNAYKYALFFKKKGLDICRKSGEKSSSNQEINESKKIFESLLGTNYRDRALSELAHIAKLQGDFEKAKDYYEILLNEMPDNNYWVRLYLGEIELRLGNCDAAKKYFEIVIEKDRDPKNKLRARLFLGQTELKLKQFEQAKKHFEFMRQNGSKYGLQFIMPAIVGLGEVEFCLGNYEQAKEYLLMVISENDKEKYWAMILLGNIECESKNFEESAKYYRIVKAECKRSRVVLMAEEGLAEIEFWLNNYSEASKIFKNILDKVEPSKKMKIKERLQTIANREYNLGNQAYKSGNLEEAVVHLKNALDYNDQKYWVMIILGNVYITLGELDEARIYYETVRKESDIHKLTAIRGLGEVEFLAGNYAKAKQHFLSALEFGNGHGVLTRENEEFIRNRLAVIEIELKDQLGAKKNVAVGYLSCKLQKIYELGQCEFQLGNLDEAKKHFENLINGSDASSITDKKKIDYTKLYLGEIEYGLGNIEKSIEYFDGLIKGDSSIKVRAILNMVRLYIKQKDYLNTFKYFSYLDEEMIASSGCRPAVEILRLYLMHGMNDNLDYQIGYRNISSFQSSCDYDMDQNVNCEINFANLYDVQQAFEYSEDVALGYVIGKYGAVFSENIDIYGVFDNISSYLKEEYKLRRIDGNNDIYDIPFENIGNGINTLRVVTIPNTNCILTMFPVEDNRTKSKSRVYN